MNLDKYKPNQGESTSLRCSFGTEQLHLIHWPTFLYINVLYYTYKYGLFWPHWNLASVKIHTKLMAEHKYDQQCSFPWHVAHTAIEKCWSRHSNSKRQPWPSQEQSQLLFGCFRSSVSLSSSQTRTLCGTCPLPPFVFWGAHLFFFFYFSLFLSLPCSGPLSTWATCSTLCR